MGDKKMNTLTIQEATALMHSYGIRCDRNKVKEWLEKGKLVGYEQEDGNFAMWTFTTFYTIING